MNIGIIGSEGKKFSPLGEERARDAIRAILLEHKPDHVVSGHCHLGGIDIYAEEAADDLGYSKRIFPPAEHNWANGYKPRNLQIAHNSDILFCITVANLPSAYTGMVFKGCYHCDRYFGLGTGQHDAPTGGPVPPKVASGAGHPGDHVKSGGCWTVIQGIKRGKIGKWIIIDNE